MRHLYTLVLLIFLLGVPTLYFLRQNAHPGPDYTLVDNEEPVGKIAQSAAEGGVIMGRLDDPELKAELGRSTWRLLHTMTARYSEHPTPDERQALNQFIHLLSRLYPCGECATEFQQILKKYPPQTSSRESASQWACAVHNVVNTRLHKPQFDCSTIADKYKCGCDDDTTPARSDGAPSVKDQIEEVRAEERARLQEVERKMAEVEADIDG